MKWNVFVGALIVAMTATSSLFAGEPSRAMLNKMGLSGMKPMTGSQGSEVRGMGTFAYVGGFSSSSLLGNTGTNGYLAGASHHTGSSLAVGASISVSGVGGVTPFGSGFILGGSVGGSIAYAR